MDGIAVQIKRLTAVHPVLFIGTPCQTAGIRAAVPEKHQGNLFLIDLLCHGVPSPKALSDYFAYLAVKPHDVNFRDYTNSRWGGEYALTLKEAGKMVSHRFSKDLYLKAFLDNISLNACCAECRYTSLDRVGDLSVGDFWGVDNILKDPRITNRSSAPVGLLIQNNQKFAALLNKIAASGQFEFIECTKEEACRSNEVLRTAPKRSRHADMLQSLAAHINLFTGLRVYYFFKKLKSKIKHLKRRIF